MYVPILDRVLCRDLSRKKENSLVPEAFQETLHEAEVVAVGDAVYVGGATLPMPVSVGDKIRFNPLAVEPIDMDGETMILIRVPDIYLVDRAGIVQ